MAISLTVDIVVFTFEDSALKVLLVRRRKPPHRGRMALPGGFVKEKENLEHAALRELNEETGLRHVSLEQLYSYGDPRRDPRGRVVSIAYLALVAPGRPLRAGSDAAEAAWVPLGQVAELALTDGLAEFLHEHGILTTIS